MPGSSDEARSDPTAPTATSTGLVRRRPGLVWLLAALVVPLLLTVALLAVRSGPTEDELRERSLAALAARGLTGVQVEFSGRDATVVVPAGADANQAREVVAAVDGVRAARANGGNSDLAQTAPPSTASTPGSSEPTPGAGGETVIAPFSMTRTNESLTVQAVVGDQAAKDAIVAEAQGLLEEGVEFVDQLSIDPAGALPDPVAVSALLRALSIGSDDASVKYDGATVTLTGKVSDQATKATAARAAAKAVPGAVIANELQVPAIEKPAISEACQTFEPRLAQFGSQYKFVFLSGTAIVNEETRGSVARAAALLKSCETAIVEVAGHTDNLGDPATSLPLSQQRADAVKAGLVKLGVPADRITSRGYGESLPVASNSTAAGRIANRRVEIRVP